MRTITAIKTEKASFMAGLKWVPLADHSRRNRITKEMRTKIELQGATKIIIHSASTDAGIQSALGLYAANELEQQIGKRLYSLAVAFVHARPDHPQSILAWRLNEKRAAVIIIQNGIPVADEVQDEKDAIQLMKRALSGRMGQQNHVIYTNDPAVFLNGEQITEDDFAQLATKATKLTSVPARPAVVIGTAAVAAVAVIGSMLAYQSHEAERRAKLAAQIAAEDPLPAYQAALALQIRQLGFDRQSLLQLLADVQAHKVWDVGWKLVQIECTSGQCLYTWDRDGGMTAALLEAYPDAELAEGSTSEKAVLRRPAHLPLAGLAGLQQAVPQNIAASYVNVYQTWRNAKVTVTESENAADFIPWPTPTQGHVSALPREQALKARKITVDVAMPLAQELVITTPQAVWWKAVKVVVTPGDAKKMLIVTLTGNTYVR